ncbi:hypothetical protein LTR91_000605 [Friedmanniomyces endolithicus]|uniref:Uncharacterized protein n=1 Tax=Friedmanniomyces endolithicus TaxID=329885 RepID=A0AAN6G053_9PEZI|nr:hypothetical protein LTR35_013199 [Friedmanniomyces endolithicus]KAK0298477.1 hypothetical protein LTS00_002857 [Friedmanniomyces endolithicus]KAK0309239.1 hypothetical protein LTR01_004346 [Friedmanniomyces endolithicus]KAK0327682.1 hypothetical protein LTR82_001199 [Friedmanniomyces endolithicus]KAK0832989.1 hypothetical protein LTR73_002077 [Friedmanniomyces endolithicus]
MAAPTTNPLFAPIAKHRVTPTNPPNEKFSQGLDVDRCAALHNTLMLYGWIASGLALASLQKKSWWSRHGSQSLLKVLRPELVRFLGKIFDVEGHCFFYHLRGLARPGEMMMLGEVLEDEELGRGLAGGRGKGLVGEEEEGGKWRFVVLYATPEALVSHPAGLVYDQLAHRAILMPTYHHVFDLRDKGLPWQSLETVLSAYIDMVEAEKVLALHAEVHAASNGIPGLLPWLAQPYTQSDLTSCLETWQKLVFAIEKKAEIQRSDDLARLCSRSALDAANVPKGFAHDLLLHATSSSIWFIAPGIRLPKVEEFIYQPFAPICAQFPAETAGMKMPFLFLRCPGEVSAKDAKFRYPFSTLSSVPCGLYLDAFPNAKNPFEDACRLVLPIRLGGNRYARTSDFRPIRKTFSDLYQVDINPFVMRHGPKLVGILENWLGNVESGHWRVNALGVEGGLGVWRLADTREDWWRYQGAHMYL